MMGIEILDMTFLQILWFALIAVLIGGYFILDGFDLGAGVLYPFIAKNDKEKATIRRAIGPVWDGNEVWLITAGGALFAAYPPAYATTFSGFYLAVMLVLFGLILRAVSLEYRVHDNKWGKIWNACFFIGSLLPALLFGVAIGNVFAGIPMDAAGNFSGLVLLDLVTPFTLVCGLVGLALFLCQGVCWIALKTRTRTDLNNRAEKWRMPLQVVALVLFIVLTLLVVLNLGFVGPAATAAVPTIVLYIVAVLFVVAIGAAIFFGLQKKDLLCFISQSASAFILVVLFALSMFPNFVVAAPGFWSGAASTAGSITVASAANSELTLMVMTIITCIGLPIVLFYHVLVYYKFRGRIQEEDLIY